MGGLLHFVCDDDLEWSAYSPMRGGQGVIALSGNIACKGEIVVQVQKTLVVFADDLDEDPYVQTDSYSYNAWVRGWETFLRYDNAHAHKGHADEHHRHECEWKSGLQIALTHVGEEKWPTLGAVIREVEAWHAEHRLELTAPDECASLDTIRNATDVPLLVDPMSPDVQVDARSEAGEWTHIGTMAAPGLGCGVGRAVAIETIAPGTTGSAHADTTRLPLVAGAEGPFRIRARVTAVQAVGTTIGADHRGERPRLRRLETYELTLELDDDAFASWLAGGG